MPNPDPLDAEMTSQARITQTKIRRVNAASELAGSVYSLVEFYTYYARMANEFIALRIRSC